MLKPVLNGGGGDDGGGGGGSSSSSSSSSSSDSLTLRSKIKIKRSDSQQYINVAFPTICLQWGQGTVPK